MKNIFNDIQINKENMDNISVVHIKTEYYKRGKRFYASKVITPIKSLSKGRTFNDEVTDIGSEAIKLITNLNEVDDGYYTLIITNISRDYETGYIDDYDFTLFPYEK